MLPKRPPAGLGGSAGGAPAGVVDPKALKRGFAGVACPADANRDGAELDVVDVAAELFAPPKRLGPDAFAPPNRLPEAAGLLAPPNTLPLLAEAALPAALPNRPPPPPAVVPAPAPKMLPADFSMVLFAAPKPPKTLAAPA